MATNDYSPEALKSAQDAVDTFSREPQEPQGAKRIYEAAKGVGEASAKVGADIARGSPVLAGYETYKRNDFEYSPIANAIMKHDPTGAVQMLPPATKAGIAEMESLGSWVYGGALGGEAGGALERPIEGLVGSLKAALYKVGAAESPNLARAELQAIASGEKLATEEQIGAYATRAARAEKAVRVGAAAGVGALFGAGQTGLEEAQGEKPRLASNIALNVLLSSAFGLYGANTLKRVQQHMPELEGLLSTTDKESFQATNAVAGDLMRTDKLAPETAVNWILKVAQGTGNDTERMGVANALGRNPQWARTAAGRKLMALATQPASPEYEVTEPQAPGVKGDQSPVEVSIVDNQGQQQVIRTTAQRWQERYRPMVAAGKIFATHVKGPPDIVQGFDQDLRARRLDFRMPEQDANKALDTFESGDQFTLQFMNQKGVQPRAIDEKPMVAYSPTKLPVAEDVQAQVGEPTLAGTPVVVPGVEAILPVAVEPTTGIPDVTDLRQPSEIKLNTQKSILAAFKGNNAAAFDVIGTRGVNMDALEKLTSRGVLKPEDTQHADLARTIGARLEDYAGEEVDAGPKRDQILQNAHAFMRRAYELRNEPVPPELDPKVRGVFPRSIDGSIVRTVDNQDGSVTQVDSQGRAAKVRKGAVAFVPQEILNGISIDTSNLAKAADEAKKLEASTQPTLTVIQRTPPRRGLRPEEPHQDIINLAQAGINDPSKIAILEARVRQMQERMSPAAFAAFKQQVLDAVHEEGPEQETFEQAKAALGGDIAEEEQRIGKMKKQLTGEKLKAAMKVKPGEVAREIRPQTTQEKFDKIANEIAKAFKGLKKGAITVPRGRVLKEGALYAVADRHNAKVTELPEGFVIEHAGGSRVFLDSREKAFDYFNKMTTHVRIAAEQDKMVAEDAVRMPSMSALSPLYANADKLASGESAHNNPEARFFGGHLRYKPGMIRTPLRRQLATLDSMGPGGRWLSSLANHYWSTMEAANAADFRHIYAAVRQIKRMGGTVRTLEDGTAPKGAMDLYKSVILPVLNSHYQNATVFGIAGEKVVNKIYVPHLFDFTPEDISDTVFQEMQEKAARSNQIIADKKQAAAMLADPDKLAGAEQPTMLGAFQGGRPKMSEADRAEYVRWLQQKSTALSASLERQRAGKANYMDDLEAVLNRNIRSRNKRLSEAAVFGPSLERLNAAINMIGNNSPVMTEPQMVAQQIMNDVRGRVYNPVGRLQVGAMDAARGALLLSAPRHLGQYTMLMMRHGMTRTLWSTLGEALHPIAGRRMARDIAANLDTTRFEITEGVEGENSTASETVLNRFAHEYGKAGSALLHGTVNTVRRIGMRTGFNEFDRLMPKALTGSKKALGQMSEILQTKVTPEMLATMDRDSLRNTYAKQVADWAGLTFRPQDMPMFARSNVGRFLLQFRSFMWGFTGNWFNSLTNQNVSRSVRAARALRSLMLVPAVSILTAEMYKKVGANTVDSGLALRAWDDFQKNPVGQLANLELESAINIHLLGFASDLLQGLNTGNVELGQRALQVSPAALNLGYVEAASIPLAIDAAETGDPKTQEQAWNYGTAFLGSAGSAARAALHEKFGFKSAAKKPVRLPKKTFLAGRF